MPQNKQTNVLVSTKIATELIAILKSASIKKALSGREKQVAAASAAMLEMSLVADKENERIAISIQVIADILRIILMILIPDPLIRGLVEFLGKVK